MNYSKSIAVFLIAGAVCLTAATADAQSRGRGRDDRGRSGGSVGRAAPRASAPSRYYGPSRYYAPSRYYSPRILGYAPYRPYYYPYRPGITLGFYAGYGYPYGYPYYYGGYYPYGYRSYDGYGPYGYALPPAGYVSMRPGYAYGGVRIQGAPREGQVFVDGYYVGIVDDFDGAFQHVNLEAGRHQIEVRLPGGGQPAAFEVNVQPGQTITYHAGIIQ